MWTEEGAWNCSDCVSVLADKVETHWILHKSFRSSYINNGEQENKSESREGVIDIDSNKEKKETEG